MTRDSTPGTDPSDSVEAQRAVGVHPLIALSVLNHVGFSGARVCLTLSALHLQASTFVVGALLALLGVLPMLLAVAGGRWVDRIGARVPMILGTGLLIAPRVANRPRHGLQIQRASRWSHPGAKNHGPP